MVLKRGESLTQRNTLSDQRKSEDTVVHEGTKATQMGLHINGARGSGVHPGLFVRNASKIGCSFRISKFNSHTDFTKSLNI